jgi:aldehyde:ferredoxin oxidoreductase
MIEVPEAVYRDFVGGSGLAAALLYPVLEEEVDPLSEYAPLLLATGPLTGTRGPSVGRFTICGKSPATGLWAESNIGGNCGAELRAAGFDGFWITGKSESPVYLWICNGTVEIQSATHLWGKLDTYEAQTQIRADLGQKSARIMTIGYAGERQLPYALILSDHGRVAGRTGMGAVMGAKNLKAIAIRGSETIPLARPGQFGEIRSRTNRELREDLVSQGLRDFGTASASDVFDYFGMMPKKYFSKGEMKGTEKISGPSLSESILSGVSTCHGCVIACGRKVRFEDGVERKGPEYETVIGFGPNLGLTDLNAITLMGERCDQLGMDTISFSNTLGLAMYLFEQGVISGSDTEGVDLAWGNVEGILAMIEATAKREGFGATIAMGAKHLAEAFNAAGTAAEVNGLELPYHDPRGASGVGLVYATSPRGGCHNQSHYYMVEIGQTMESIGIKMLARQQIEGKPANVALHQDWTSILNALVMCILANVPVSDTLELLNLATDWDYSIGELIESGERIWNLKRMINVRLGVKISDERLPAHLMTPLATGGATGIIPPLDDLLAEYYVVRGWDAKTGVPTLETRQRMGLDVYQ